MIDLDELADEMSGQSIPADPSSNSSYTVVDNEVYCVKLCHEAGVEYQTRKKERIKGMVAIRNCAQELVDMQLEYSM